MQYCDGRRCDYDHKPQSGFLELHNPNRPPDPKQMKDLESDIQRQIEEQVKTQLGKFQQGGFWGALPKQQAENQRENGPINQQKKLQPQQLTAQPTNMMHQPVQIIRTDLQDAQQSSSTTMNISPLVQQQQLTPQQENQHSTRQLMNLQPHSQTYQQPQSTKDTQNQMQQRTQMKINVQPEISNIPAPSSRQTQPPTTQQVYQQVPMILGNEPNYITGHSQQMHYPHQDLQQLHTNQFHQLAQPVPQLIYSY